MGVLNQNENSGPVVLGFLRTGASERYIEWGWVRALATEPKDLCSVSLSPSGATEESTPSGCALFSMHRQGFVQDSPYTPTHAF